MDTITGKILKLHNWPDGKIIGITKKIGEQLGEQGLDRETILARLDAVRQDPGSGLTPLKSPLPGLSCLSLPSITGKILNKIF